MLKARYTVVGGQGFVGRALVANLRKDGHDVWVPEKNDPSLFSTDLGQVFYCAGLTADYLIRPHDTVQAHVSLLNSLLRDAEFAHLVYLSSTRVYDGLSGVVDEDSNLQVNPNNPRHLYDLSKLLGESLCLKSGKASIARLACVYHDEQDLDGFLPSVLRQVLECQSDELRLETSPYYVRDYVALSDVVNALRAISSVANTSIYNLASGVNVSNAQLFEVIETLIPLKIICASQAHPSESPVASADKMYREFKWKATSVLDEIRRILIEKRHRS